MGRGIFVSGDGLDFSGGGVDRAGDLDTRILRLRDGLSLGYRVYGDPAGAAVIALHGTPGSRLKFAGMHATARTRGLAIIAPDRWGYGLSDSKAGGRLADYAGDIAALADELALSRFGMLGVSGGGPFAVGVAAELGDRVDRLGLVAPIGLVGPDAGRDVAMTAFHRWCFRGLPRVPGGVAAMFQMLRLGLRVAPDLAVRASLMAAPESDRRIASRREVRMGIARMYAEGLRNGVQGPVTDMALFGAVLGFALEQVTAPVQIWLGSADRNVPLDAVVALHQALPRSRLAISEGAGHLWLTDHADVVADWFACADGGDGVEADTAAVARLA